MLTDKLLPFNNPEIWGGIECTINRTGNKFNDQLILSGHYFREDDINKIAALGIKALRYPILWEKHQPSLSEKINWVDTEKKLDEIKNHDIKIIAGLLHHGSGPDYTSLDDAMFPQKLAVYAKFVATKFPWIEYYTPVNEPLTTARFSGLYGHWYPHKKNSYAFLSMLINQLTGTVLSMQEIRKINSEAKLVQTEDLGKTHSTSLLKYQADFENERRWLTFDLLCGKVNKSHCMWNYLLSEGITKNQLLFFINNPCPPNIMGLNYYVTSERWIDERTDLYHPSTYGGNYKHNYADTEAVRAGQMQGLSVLLNEAWKRYQIKISITEAHLSCTREEQMRWFNEIWQQACALKKGGINILSVTAWSLLGAYDWNSLLTKNNNHYEAGIFDVSSNSLRPTAMAGLIKQLTNKTDNHHPLIYQKGWWNKGLREENKNDFLETINDRNNHSPLLIIGKSGTLGNAFDKICYTRSIPHKTLGRAECNIENENEIQQIINHYKPWAIVNATGYVKVDEAENDAEMCYRINSKVPALLAKVCNNNGIKLMTFSSDYVFGGEKISPYTEADKVNPLNIYGKSKAEGEKFVCDINNNALVIRTSTFFGPWDNYNFISNMLSSINLTGKFFAADDVSVSPTYVPDLVNASLDLLIDNESGIWHLCNNGSMTWSQLAVDIMERAGLQKNNIIAQPSSRMNFKALRPAYSVLSSDKGKLLPSLKTALDNFFYERNGEAVAS